MDCSNSSEFDDEFGTSSYDGLIHISCHFHIKKSCKTAACYIPRYNFIVPKRTNTLPHGHNLLSFYGYKCYIWIYYYLSDERDHGLSNLHPPHMKYETIFSMSGKWFFCVKHHQHFTMPLSNQSSRDVQQICTQNSGPWLGSLNSRRNLGSELSVTVYRNLMKIHSREKNYYFRQIFKQNNFSNERVIHVHW